MGAAALIITAVYTDRPADTAAAAAAAVSLSHVVNLRRQGNVEKLLPVIALTTVSFR